MARRPDEPTPEEIAEQNRQLTEQAAMRRQEKILSPENGWPAKALHDVRNVPLRGEKWKLAYDTALASLQRNGVVILYGYRGTGKTRMVAELALELGFGKYMKAMRFFLEVRATYKPGCEKDELDVVTEIAAFRFLVLDEIQVRGGKPFEDNLLTNLIDDRYGAMLPTLIIANLEHDQLGESLGASIVDRVSENGAVICCDWGSFRTAIGMAAGAAVPPLKSD